MMQKPGFWRECEGVRGRKKKERVGEVRVGGGGEREVGEGGKGRG